MPKYYFHNSKKNLENKEQKIIIPKLNSKIKTVVDINILLNKVRLEEKNETRKKIVFFSFATVAISLFGTFIAIIK